MGTAKKVYCQICSRLVRQFIIDGSYEEIIAPSVLCDECIQSDSEELDLLDAMKGDQIKIDVDNMRNAC